MPPKLKGILETPVYVDDLTSSHAFYHGVLGLDRMIQGDRIQAYNAGPGQVLLVCLRGACDEDASINGHLVPGHRSDGASHFAFRIDKSTLSQWIEYLQNQGVVLESRVQWPMGGESIYFRDPFDNVVELATQGVWPNDPIEE